MVKDHSDSEKGNPPPPHRLLFLINSKCSFYMHHPTDRIAHTTTFVTPVVEHWLKREIATNNGILNKTKIQVISLIIIVKMFLVVVNKLERACAQFS